MLFYCKSLLCVDTSLAEVKLANGASPEPKITLFATSALAAVLACSKVRPVRGPLIVIDALLPSTVANLRYTHVYQPCWALLSDSYT